MCFLKWRTDVNAFYLSRAAKQINEGEKQIKALMSQKITAEAINAQHQSNSVATDGWKMFSDSLLLYI